MTISRLGLHFTDQGQGSLVLLIHGMAGTSESHLGPLFGPLVTEGWRVVAPDLRGHGASQKLAPHQGPQLIAAHTSDLVALVEELAPPSLHLIGYSDGGEIVLQLAARLGALVRGVAVWGTSGQLPPAPIVALYRDPAKTLPDWPTFAAELTALHGPNGPQLLTIWAEAMAELAASGAPYSPKTLAEIACPCLILSGDRDPFNPLPAVQALAQRLPSARLMILPNSGHDLLAERSTDLSAIVRRFLQHTAEDSAP